MVPSEETDRRDAAGDLGEKSFVRISIALLLVIISVLALSAITAGKVSTSRDEGAASLALPVRTVAPCGVERWAVKTLADAEGLDLPTNSPKLTTVAALRAIKPPTRKQLDAAKTTRLTMVEISAYEIRAEVVGYKLEADEDYHVVIADPGKLSATMIAEIPAPDCVPNALSAEFAGIRADFDALVGRPTKRYRKLATPVAVTLHGVGFFDFLHGQTGVAPNGIELHPVVGIYLTK